MTKIKTASECFHAICSSVTSVMGTEMPRAFSEGISWGKKWKKCHSDLLCLGPPICTAIYPAKHMVGLIGVQCAVCSVCTSSSVLSTQFLLYVEYFDMTIPEIHTFLTVSCLQ